MSEQFLNDAEVRSTLEEMRRKRVPKRVRAHSSGEACGGGSALHSGPRLLPCEATSTVAEEDGPSADRGHVMQRKQARTRAREPPAEHFDRDLADRHEPLLVALADHPNEGAVEGDILEIQAEGLRDAKARRIEQLEEHAITQPRVARIVGPRRVEEALDLRDRQRLGKQAGHPRQVEVRRDVDIDETLAEREAIEPAN
jgi:hypothetical protein